MHTYIIVDDEKLIREGTAKKLDSISSSVVCVGKASNGREALDLIERLNPDIIITDMNMPVLDGTQLLPILTEKYPAKRIIVISGYKDFEYTKHAITAKAVDYILKPFGKEVLQKAVMNAVQQLDDDTTIKNKLISSEAEKESVRYDYDLQMLKNMMLGYPHGDASITSDRLSFINHSRNFILLTLHSRKALDSETLIRFIEENDLHGTSLYLPHLQTSHLGFVLLFMPESTPIAPNDLGIQIASSIHHLFDSQDQAVSFGISSRHTALSQLNDAFAECISALNFRLLNVSTPYAFFTSHARDSLAVEWPKADELLFRIEAGMTDQVVELMHDLFRSLHALPKCTLSDVKYYCFNLADQAKSVMTQYFDQINPNSVSTSMQNILNSMFSPEEIRDYYIQFFSNIAQTLRSRSVYAGDDTPEKIKTYIQRNYQKNLTVEFVSSLFYLNRAYCSHMFREKTGERFVDYLNDIRIEKAKQLLSGSDKKMYQIAKTVGYDNVKYFFRIFKKKTGMTPEQYRTKA